MMISRHAKKKMRQRGFLKDDIDMIFRYGQISMSFGHRNQKKMKIWLNGKSHNSALEEIKRSIRTTNEVRVQNRISGEEYQKTVSDLKRLLQKVERAKNKLLIVSRAGSTIITMYKKTK
jgi:hypothetical protein